jgi:amidophosphoribosyltransferase
MRSEILPPAVEILEIGGDEALDKPREECGVVGVYSPEGDAQLLTREALEALQHRGHEGAGVSFNAHNEVGFRIGAIKGVGRVATVFGDGEDLRALPPINFATGHVRYGTSQFGDKAEGVQPMHSERGNFTIAQNGNFLEESLRELALERGIQPGGTDTKVFTDLLGDYVEEFRHIEPAMHRLLPQLEGAFSLVALTEEGIYAARDTHAVRPLVLGTIRDTGALVVASEVVGLEAIGAEFIKEVDPGTYVAINQHGMRKETWGNADPAPCIFELIYLSKPENVHFGVKVKEFRLRAGEMMADKDLIQGDIVVPVLGSGKYYAQGYSLASGTPYEEKGLMKNPDRKNPTSDRTFISGSQKEREQEVRGKFIVDPEAVAGKRVVLIDDSLVRGTTMNVIVAMLREAGASEVHVRVPSAKYVDTCHLGVNVRDKNELLATGRTTEQMSRAIGADSLLFLTLEETKRAAGAAFGDVACSGCLGGKYAGEPRQRTLERKLALVS